LGSKRIVKVACGGFHTLVLTSENEIYAFGSGNYGECGYGEFLDTAKPRLVKLPNIENSKPIHNETSNFGGNDYTLDMYVKESYVIADIAAGGRHSMIITEDGSLFTFGFGTNGQLGLRNTSNKAKP
jgi:alpha-tubulin suppressor-like RCC1 family protein